MSGAGNSPAASLQRIQAKLDKWELQHLREHARELAERLENSEQRAAAAENYADYWRDQFMALQEQLAEDLAIGMTADGQLGVVSKKVARPGQPD